MDFKSSIVGLLFIIATIPGVAGTYCYGPDDCGALEKEPIIQTFRGDTYLVVTDLGMNSCIARQSWAKKTYNLPLQAIKILIMDPSASVLCTVDSTGQRQATSISFK